jgi:hypothetical protein
MWDIAAVAVLGLHVAWSFVVMVLFMRERDCEPNCGDWLRTGIVWLSGEAVLILPSVLAVFLTWRRWVSSKQAVWLVVLGTVPLVLGSSAVIGLIGMS